MKTDKQGEQGMKETVSRREFMGGAAAALALTVVPSHVLGQNAPSNKLNIAGIGVGGRGGGDMNEVSSENIVALCDVDWAHASGTFRKFSKAKRYRDFRKMLDEMHREIDAVVVATPDHVHAPASMMAIKLGKHVYCEKPLTHSVYEARKVAEAAREYKVATQMGNQGQASEDTRLTCEYIWAGAIGPVREVHIWTDRPLRGLLNWYWPQGVDRPTDTPKAPDTLDWDLWLGPAPQRPYHPAYVPFKWRGWWDFGTGALGDIGCHSFDAAFRALKLGHPKSVEAMSSLVNRETYPVASIVHYEFPARGDMPPLDFYWYDGGLKPPRPVELEDGSQWGTNGKLYVGDKGKMLGYLLIPEEKRRETPKPPQVLPRSPGHHREWIEACKGGKPAGSNFDFAGPLAEAVLLGNVALRYEMKEELTRKKLLWDGPNLRFTNSTRANDFLHREYRKGWTL